MKDLLLDEKCEHCGYGLTLMESVAVPSHELWLVKRCLHCFSHPTEEVIKIYDDKKDEET